MYYIPKIVTLPGGRRAEFRPPDPAQDAAAMAAYLHTVCGETDFLSRGPEEINLTEAQEAAFLQKCNRNPKQMMILPFVEGKLAGSASLTIGNTQRTAHRGTIGIALYRRFWGIGLGAALLRELAAAGRQKKLRFLELQVAEDNRRAVSLYERQGYQVLCKLPEAAILSDGRTQTLLTMRKPL